MPSQKRVKLIQADQETVVEGNAHGETALQRRARVLRGRRGGLKDMPNMPIDIINEVCGHLHPRDLLYLARTSKAFRDLLMSRCSAFIWRASREHVAYLPECPSHLSEPAYANLAFTSQCHRCLKKNAKPVFWQFSARYCKGCRAIMTITQADLQAPEAGPLAFAMEQGWLNFHQKSFDVTIYHVPQIEQVLSTLKAVADNVEALAEFGEKQVARVEQIDQFAQQCEEWTERVASDRERILNEIKSKRRAKIASKLTEEGLSCLLIGLSWWTLRHPPANKSRPLTDNEWQKIRTELIAAIEFQLGRNPQYRAHARLHSLHAFVSNLSAQLPRTPSTEWSPTFVDIVLTTDLRWYVEVLDESSRLSWEYTMKRAVPKSISAWSQQTDEKLQKVLSDKTGLEDVNLAVALFECTNCGNLMHYPNVIAHQCLRSSQVSPDVIGASSTNCSHPEVIHAMQLFKMTNASAWSCAKLRITNAFPRIQELVRLCGKDPDWTVHEQMSDMEIRLCCIMPEAPRSMSVVTWHEAVQREHERASVFLSDGSQVPPLIWRVASDEEKVMALEEELRGHDDAVEEYLQQPYWCCAHCYGPGRFQTFADINDHLHMMHNKDSESVQEGDLYLHPDGRPLSPKPVTLQISSWIL